MLKAKIYVSLKKTVADPQGMTIKNALKTLGFSDVADARSGKFIELTLKLASKEEAKKEVKKMCEQLLANPIIEEFNFDISEPTRSESGK